MDKYKYALALPPRPVPWPIRTQVLFGGFFNQFGWLFFGFGMIFVWVFGLSADFSSAQFALSESKTTQGTISDIQSTSASENDTPVYANHFVFRVEREETDYAGVSYTTGQRFSIGQMVPVQYLVDNPDVSRIEGARGNTFSPWIICLVAIFPTIGLIFIIAGLRRGVKGNRLLHNGKIGQGRLVDKSATNTRINNRTVFKLTFEFEAEDGMTYQATAKSHLTENLEDEPWEQLLYNPRNPSDAVLVDNLPGAPDIDESGNIYAANPRPKPGCFGFTGRGSDNPRHHIPLHYQPTIGQNPAPFAPPFCLWYTFFVYSTEDNLCSSTPIAT